MDQVQILRIMPQFMHMHGGSISEDSPALNDNM